MGIWDQIRYQFNKGNSAVRQIILINVGTFIFTLLILIYGRLMNAPANDFLSYFYLPGDLGRLMMRPWTLLSNIFFHGGFWHLLGNMLLLFFMGNILQQFSSREKIWNIFLGGGILGGLFFMAANNLFPTFEAVRDRAMLLGASGGVTAVIVAAGVYLPYYEIRPFGLFNIQLRWLALILVFMDLANMPSSANLGGLFAHLGGALYGLFFILHLQGKIKLPAWPRYRKSKLKRSYYNESSLHKSRLKKSKPRQEEIDAILDKISRSGYDSLNKEEKNILFKASE